MEPWMLIKNLYFWKCMAGVNSSPGSPLQLQPKSNTPKQAHQGLQDYLKVTGEFDQGRSLSIVLCKCIDKTDCNFIIHNLTYFTLLYIYFITVNKYRFCISVIGYINVQIIGIGIGYKKINIGRSLVMAVEAARLWRHVNNSAHSKAVLNCSGNANRAELSRAMAFPSGNIELRRNARGTPSALSSSESYV